MTDAESGAGDHQECPSESAHDYVVQQMHAGKDLECYYTVRCARCRALESGYVDEIPPARFEQTGGGEVLVEP